MVRYSLCYRLKGAPLNVHFNSGAFEVQGSCIVRTLFQDGAYMENPALKSLLLAAVLFGVNSGWAKTIDFGKMAYMTSCADCHGIDGKGDGPKAAGLNTKPSDLTVEAKNNKGVFPVQSIYEIIDGRKQIPASGPRQMPIWGKAFLSFGPDSQRIPENRIMGIIDYLKRIQTE